MPIVDMNVVRLWARKIARLYRLYKTHQDSLCKICNAYAMHCKARSEETWPGHPSALLTALPQHMGQKRIAQVVAMHVD